MEDALRVLISRARADLCKVLILVLMEDTLRAALNLVMWLVVNVLILVLMEDTLKEQKSQPFNY